VKILKERREGFVSQFRRQQHKKNPRDREREREREREEAKIQKRHIKKTSFQKKNAKFSPHARVSFACARARES
jgi:hypothetical protein